MVMKGGKMIRLNENELNNIEGGEVISTGIGIGLIVSTIVIFLSGVFKGYTNPEACNVKGN